MVDVVSGEVVHARLVVCLLEFLERVVSALLGELGRGILAGDIEGAADAPGTGVVDAMCAARTQQVSPNGCSHLGVAVLGRSGDGVGGGVGRGEAQRVVEGEPEPGPLLAQDLHLAGDDALGRFFGEDVSDAVFDIEEEVVDEALYGRYFTLKKRREDGS